MPNPPVDPSDYVFKVSSKMLFAEWRAIDLLRGNNSPFPQRFLGARA
jgi:hypothetical protein